VFIGADAISSTGIALCKSGSYPTALVAHAHGVPFYVAADTLKFDPTSIVGLPFRPSLIGREFLGHDDLPERAEVVGHFFDETPPHLIAAIITEIGLIHPTAVFSVMREAKLSQRLNTLLLDWARGTL
jgi:methylthioribose-1-phosphate isomerase